MIKLNCFCKPAIIRSTLQRILPEISLKEQFSKAEKLLKQLGAKTMRISFYLFCSVSLLSGFVFGKIQTACFTLYAEANGELRNAVQFYQKPPLILTPPTYTATWQTFISNLSNMESLFSHYRKALLLRPDDRELKTNLAFAIEISGIPNEKPVSLTPPTPQSFLGMEPWLLVSSSGWHDPWDFDHPPSGQ